MTPTNIFDPDNNKAGLKPDNLFSTCSKFKKTTKYTKGDFVFLETKYTSNFLKPEIQKMISKDLPKIIQKRFWMHLYSKKQTYVILENLSIDDECKWLILFAKEQLTEDGETRSYQVIQEKPLRFAIKKIEVLYQKLHTIEQTMGIDVAENYFERMLQEEDKTYDQFMKQFCVASTKELTFENLVAKKTLTKREKTKNAVMI